MIVFKFPLRALLLLCLTLPSINIKAATDHWFYQGLQAWDQRNYAKARDYFGRSAIKGNPEACYNLAILYQKGYGIRPDHHRAKLWFKRAARYGHSIAQYTLARMIIAKRRKTYRDIKQAKRWLTKAADNNHAPSMYWLGTMYTMGQGVRISHKQAANWYLQAARNGFGTAQLHMARNYNRGIGVRKSRAKAYAWIKLAMRQRVSRAVQNWRYINKRMSAAQRSEGEQLAQRYYKLYLKTGNHPQ